jgi:plastocyanin
MSEKVYVVTLRRREDLEQFYTDMSDGGYRLNMKRPISRNTHYWMTDEQAETIRQDSRVLAVELRPEELGMKPGPRSFYNTTEYNIQGEFDKSGTNTAAAVNWRQWGHLHAAGTTAQRAKGTWTTGQVTDNTGVNIYNDGKHVDVVICDDRVGRDCEEFHSPTTGLTRFVQYEWYNELNTYVSSIDDDSQSLPTGNYPYIDNAGNPDYHGTHVAGTAAGQFYGWAREANIYNISAYGTGAVSALLLFDYLRAFHRNKPINPETGKRNPTITNHSWGYGYDPADYGYDGNIPLGDVNYIEWAGVIYNASNPGPSGWTWAGIEADFGVRESNGTIPSHYAALNADIEDAIEDGVVVVTAAGNENYYIAEEGDPEWNNKVYFQGFGGWIYMNRGGSPSGTRGVINVGALGVDSNKRAGFTNYGPGIDVFAPGLFIHSAFNATGPVDPKYTQGSGNYFAAISGTSMASPQVCGLIALAASGKERFTQSDAIAIVDRFGKAGDMTFDVNPVGANSYSISFDAAGSSAYLISGQDRVTTHSSASNATITITEGDTLTLSQPTGSAYVTIDGETASSSYIMTVNDRVSTNQQLQDPTINVEEGDALTMEFQVTLSMHPIRIQTLGNVDVPNVYGQGSSNAFEAIGWSPENCPAPGTYKYICVNHGNMTGNIVVHAKGTYYNHPLYLKTTAGTGTGNQVSGATGQGANSNDEIQWTAPTGSAGTYYYQCSLHSGMVGQVVVNSPQGVLGQAGNHADNSCQKGSPNLEIFADNPRESTGYIAGWYREVLKGSRRTKPWDQGDRQIFPRTNTYFRP